MIQVLITLTEISNFSFLQYLYFSNIFQSQFLWYYYYNCQETETVTAI